MVNSINPEVPAQTFFDSACTTIGSVGSSAKEFAATAFGTFWNYVPKKIYDNSPDVCGENCKYLAEKASNCTSSMWKGATSIGSSISGTFSEYTAEKTVAHTVGTYTLQAGSYALQGLAMVVPPVAAGFAADSTITLLQGKAAVKNTEIKKAVIATAISAGTILLGCSSTEERLMGLSIALGSALAVSMYKAANAKAPVYLISVEDLRKLHKASKAEESDATNENVTPNEEVNNDEDSVEMTDEEITENAVQIKNETPETATFVEAEMKQQVSEKAEVSVQ